MDKLKVFGVVLLSLSSLFVVVSQLLPDRWRIERTAVFRATPQAIYPYLNNLRRWHLWSQWDDIDPHMQREFSSPSEGLGASQRWRGPRVGSGSLTLTESDVDHSISYDLALQHHAYVAHGRVNLTPVGGTTRVTWVAYGEVGYNPISRYFGVILDNYMGGDVEQNLAKLQALSESTQ